APRPRRAAWSGRAGLAAAARHQRLLEARGRPGAVLAAAERARRRRRRHLHLPAAGQLPDRDQRRDDRQGHRLDAAAARRRRADRPYRRDRDAQPAGTGRHPPARARRRRLGRVADGEVTKRKRSEHVEARVEGERMLVARTGYTGERGLELFPRAERAERLFERLLALEWVKPAGLGARDTLRLEAGN